jgi:choline dehydrogenase
VAPGFPYFLGKVLGGSSAVNGAIALRALPRDFDQWAAGGNPEWAWEHVRDYFGRLEQRIPVRRPGRDELDGTELAFWRACTGLGLSELADLNGCAGAGVGVVPVNAVHGRRICTAAGYLNRARGRPNLHIATGCTASRVVIDAGRAAGVEIVCGGRSGTVRARNVTVSAGAIGTPAILLRSGVGDPQACRSLGIRPTVDLPGVGRNLVDHPVAALWAVPRPGTCRDGAPWHRVLARVASRRGAEPDLNVMLLNNVATAMLPVVGDMLGTPTAVGVSVMLHRPLSRGRVTLADPDPDAAPVIELALGSDPRDVDALMAGVRVAWSIISSPEVARRLDRVLLWTERMVGSDALLRRAVENFVSPSLHPAGTARMGPSTDRGAVVDQRCRVHGVANLRVVDASVMPAIPSVPLNLTCIALAERVAGWIDGRAA